MPPDRRCRVTHDKRMPPSGRDFRAKTETSSSILLLGFWLGSPRTDFFLQWTIRFALALGVVDFVTAKAPSFNKIRQSSTTGPQTIQQESLKNNKIQQTLA